MICPNCGYELKDTEKVCPICQTNCEVTIKQTNNSAYEEYKETERLNEKYGFNKILILSVLELLCCAQLFGLAAIVFLFLKLKPAIVDRNFEEADKWKNIIKVILIVGLVSGILVLGFNVVLQALPVIFELSQILV